MALKTTKKTLGKKKTSKKRKIVPVDEPKYTVDDEEVGDLSIGEEEEEVSTITTTTSFGGSKPPSVHVGEVKGLRALAGKEAVTTLITVTMLDTVDPAPTVGGVDLVKDYDLPVLRTGRSYRLPYCVAIVLVDRNKATPSA